MTTTALLVAAGALAAGLLIGWLLARASAGARAAGLRAELESERRRAEDQAALVVSADARFREAFSALSADALKANNQQFLDLASAHLGKYQESASAGLKAREQAIQALVKPIEDGLKRVDERIGAVEKDRTGAYAELRAHVEEMAKSQQLLRSETQNLVRALRTPHVRGAWGEIQLRRVVEMAGMLEHCDFTEQVSTDDGDGGRLRPDLIIRLPGGKSIVVDSKAPLSRQVGAHPHRAGAPRSAGRWAERSLGNGLSSATLAYNDAVGSFETRALVSARKFTELGAGQGKEIPEVEVVEVGVRGVESEL